MIRLGLERFNPAQGGARGMKLIAGGMLLAMAAIFVSITLARPVHPAWGFVRAFAEAAMVGGLADWFAVTALFRHPPSACRSRTAIIPRNKDRIGDNLAEFLRSNFLTPSVVARRLERLDVASAMARWLTAPAAGGGRLRRNASKLFADMLETLDTGALGGMVKGAVTQRLHTLDLAPPLGQALSAMIDEDRHVPVLDGLIRWAARALDANEELVRDMVHQRAGWILKLAGLDTKLADTIIDGLRKLFTDMADDPDHPIRIRIQDGLKSLARDLQADPAMQAKVARLKAEVMANPAVGRWLDGLWEQARAAMIRAARDPQAVLAGRMGEMLREVGHALDGNAPLRAAINQFARRAAVGAAADYGDAIVRLVSDTVRGWDARTVTDKLEASVGRDLQYIRINGTLVGGLVGTAIHAVDIML